MFSLAKTILRKSNIRNYSKTYSKVDSGIHWRKKYIRDGLDMEDQDFDDMESDFASVHHSHKEHVEELRHMQQKQQYYMVKQKYFKTKYPNFLTWHDKEQIKYLYNSDPQEWTVERLSEGFPALPHVIKEIVKSKWTKEPRRVKNHDLSVQKNWEMFKAGQFPNLPDHLIEHLNKFSNRALNLTPFEAPSDKKVVEVRRRKGNTEFADIITSYEKLTNKNKEQPTEDIQVDVNKSLTLPSNTDTYLTIDRKQLKWRNQVTLQTLQTKIEQRIEKGKEISVEDKLIVKGLEKNTEKSVNVSHEKMVDIAQHKYETSEVATVEKSARDYSHLIYPEKIIIPKDIRKRGYTYKLNDCYYDDDGSFLYRVPGMG